MDTVSPGDGNELLGNLAFPAHPHADDLGRLPGRRGGREAASCTAHEWAGPTPLQSSILLALGNLLWGGRGLSLGLSLIKQGKDRRASLFFRVPLATGASRGRKARR